ncbi:MAG: phosphoglycerate mutase [Cenarchaeum symbiont of Oopsacas minuta]|nr:phosphoglycerate mutase [Cenarchaeum symbiont of Oopsacas minuta]
MAVSNTKVHMVYVLLDGVGDLPHPDLKGKTPLQAAFTPNMDIIAKMGCMGEVISVGRGIAPESDIAVFNMLGYKFRHADYVGRGVIEAIGIGTDFMDGDLALRGNFATLDAEGVITDRRAGRDIEERDTAAIARELREGIKFSDKDATVIVSPTIGHRVTVIIKVKGKNLSSNITNTDPAYSRVDGMGVAKAVGDFLRIDKCLPLDNTINAILAAKLVNEFTKQSIEILAKSATNKARKDNGKKQIGCVLLRDAGNKYPNVVSINEKYSMNFSCIVDMPVEIGISKVLEMKAYNAGGLTDYEEKARVAANAMQTQNAIYVHIKGPDEFGHDGDAIGKMHNIEEIDKRFFGTLLEKIDTKKTAIVISADHSTPCINKGHSDDPVPVIISGCRIKPDGSERVTEEFAKKGRLGLLQGSNVVSKTLDEIR